MKNIVLTGGTGFIGTHLITKLTSQGYRVFIITRQKKKSDSRSVFFIRADLEKLKNFSFLKKKLPRSFTFIDLAAHIPSPRTANYSVMDFLWVNFFDHIRFFANCAERVERIVYVSTLDVYGKMEGKKLLESQARKPLTEYGLSKSFLEDYYQFVSKQKNIPVIILRLSQVYGPGAHPINAVPKWLADIKTGKSVTLYGKGEEKRTYIHVDDVAQAITLATRATRSGVYNVAGGQTRHLSEILTLIKKTSPFPVEVEHKKRMKPKVDLVVDISAITKELGFVPRVTLEEGINQIINLKLTPPLPA